MLFRSFERERIVLLAELSSFYHGISCAYSSPHLYILGAITRDVFDVFKVVLSKTLSAVYLLDPCV